MPDLDALLLFALAALVLLVTPGPSVLYVTSRTIDQGRSAGFASTLGLAVGDLIQVSAVVLGISALVASSPTAFEVVKYAGVAYLVWLGLRRLFTPDQDAGDESVSQGRVPYGRLFRDGVMVNALNPKSTLFFLALFPSFVDSSRGSTWLQTLTLGLVFVSIGVLTNGGWALFSSFLRDLLKRSTVFRRSQRYVVAGTFFLLAGVALTAGFGG
ncbi:LysE family translocator [Nocardiopsis sp. LOL_012]|uniref:LysE family translocator n=1 Tax=Nocardiopsis sp. LOL_012 TaxID=3345409 RepID=UPI003A847E76